MKRIIQLLAVICIVVGSVFIWEASNRSAARRKFEREYEYTYGIIIKNKVDTDKNYYPVIKFKTLNNQWEKFTSMEPSKTRFFEGDTVQVYYDLVNPENAHLANKKPGEGTSFVVAGILLMLIGSGIGGVLWWKGRGRRALIERGRKVTATIVAIEERKTPVQSLYRLQCEWGNNGQTSASNISRQEFYSEYILADPQPYLKGDLVTVYFDSVNPAKNYVDVSFLPQQIRLW